ncbi:MAG: TrmH family RNA methyltransferase [Candidatus Promineifilaceae bacterium]|nr:TrmH family RNA methyltransferase [Candidatus Promineifilaceae bacterium]
MKALYGTNLKRFLREYRREHCPDVDLVALLQSVEYPANVGSCFRLADGAGMKELVLTGITPTPPNATIEKVGRYKSRRVPWRYERDPLVAIRDLKENAYEIVAVELADSAVPYYEYNFQRRTCLIVGHEDHGVTRETLSACDAAVFLPMYGKGLSLNVHVALSIVSYHILHTLM